MKATALASVGSTHPWNIAGLGLDILVAQDFGVRAFSVLAGVTAQDERGVHERFAIPAQMVRAQLRALPLEQIGAVRVGALLSEPVVAEVAEFLRANGGIPAVVDPVMRATLGGMLLDAQSLEALRRLILPLPVIFTPNVPEAESLLARRVEDEASMLLAARRLQAMGPRAVLLKGGHLTGELLDVLVTESETKVFRDSRLAQTMRGTGCILAAALACALASGVDLMEAAAVARRYVRKKIEARLAFRSMYVAF